MIFTPIGVDFWSAVGVTATEKLASVGAAHPEEVAPTVILAVVA